MTAEADCNRLIEECEAKAIALIAAHNEITKLKRENITLKGENAMLTWDVRELSIFIEEQNRV